MKQGIYKVLRNEKIAKDVYLMVLAGDTSAITAPGQFVNILLAGKYLRRPISICDWDGEHITLIYKVVGGGTEQMSEIPEGEELDLLVGLGNGYDTEKCPENTLLIGGGVGVPPLYGLCKRLISEGKKPQVVLGFNTKEEVFLKEEFEKLGAKVLVATADGSMGVKGFVTDAMKELSFDYFCTCGPLPMFRAIEGAVSVSGQYSFEERMGCGFGACMGCSCKTKYGNMRICKEGPILEREEIIW